MATYTQGNVVVAGNSTTAHRAATRSTTSRAAPLVNIGGNIIDPTTERSKYIIYSRLSAAGYAVDTTTNLKDAAEELLGALGCSVSRGTLDSLSDSVTTMSDNPAILTKIDKKGASISALDKFPNVNDSFYKLDPAESRDKHRARDEQEAKHANNYTKFAADMADLMRSRR